MAYVSFYCHMTQSRIPYEVSLEEGLLIKLACGYVWGGGIIFMVLNDKMI